MLILKMDEGDAAGPMNIRIKSFVETVKARRKKQLMRTGVRRAVALRDVFAVKYTKQDRNKRAILIPNLSPGFSYMFSRILQQSVHRVG